MPDKRTFARRRFLLAALCLVLAAILSAAPALAEENLTLSSSSQVYEAFKGGSLDKFEKANKVGVKVFVTTSDAALARLSYGMSEVAAVARPIGYRLRSMGYTEIPFCKDNVVVVVQVQTTVNEMTAQQLRGVFTGEIRNWNELGGPDRPIIVVTPAKESAAYQNFSAMIGASDLYYDIMTAQSTMVMEVIRRVPWSITFVAQGATMGKPQGSRTVKIDGKGPDDPAYPYFQTYYLVTKGEPQGMAKALVKYIKGPSVSDFIKERGMTPIP